MRTLTLQKPWGWAIIHGGKDVENRTWHTDHLGPLLIHQGKGFDPSAAQFPAFAGVAPRAGSRQSRLMDMTGVILGRVEVTGCHWGGPGCCSSPWAIPGQWHWQLENPVALRTLVAARGKLGLWTPSDDVLVQVRESVPA
jgi:hypothetical protein